MPEWIKRWGYEVQKTSRPGLLKIRGGGYLLWGKAGQRIVTRVVAEMPQREAVAKRQALLEGARSEPRTSTQLFSAYATSLYERKVEQREIKSAKTRERWDTTLRLHLLPAFGPLAVGAIEKGDIESWKSTVAKRITKGKLSPNTANGWLSILLVILRGAVDDLHLERDPTLRVKSFPTAEHATYSQEEPNALTREQCSAFMVEMRKSFPQHYAMTLLGFATGLRPSTLRPLRRRGPNADVLWSEKALVVRRSNSIGQEVMETTKTGIRYRIGLPDAVMKVLEWHVAELRRHRAESDLLFPSLLGGFMSRSALDKPFAAVSATIGLPFGLSPRGMRRTFQDLARGAGVEREMRKAICGHATDGMSELYATVRSEEMREAVSRVALSVVSA